MMDGEDIKYLRTFLRDGDGTRKEIWSRYGHQGRKWRVASVGFSVPLEQSCQIIMEVERGMASSPWFIAVNDVHVDDKPCYVLSQTPHVQDEGEEMDAHKIILKSFVKILHQYAESHTKKLLLLSLRI